VPTFAGAGIMGLEVVAFYGVLAPAGAPKEVVGRLPDAFRQVLESPDIRGRIVAQGAEPAFMPSDAFAIYLASRMPVWANVVKDSGTRLD
jgi:tripartite-type tricarboxylate transporter receptor subunit TctC